MLVLRDTAWLEVPLLPGYMVAAAESDRARAGAGCGWSTGGSAGRGGWRRCRRRGEVRLADGRPRPCLTLLDGPSIGPERRCAAGVEGLAALPCW